ncbi:MAG: signal peptidase I [Clostridia bacterium]|nr:signal peptidase I [Clostridia bacterium]
MSDKNNSGNKKVSARHKILTIIGTVLCIILIPILIINLTLIAKSFLNKDEVPSIAGTMPLIVLTDSMYPEIESGDLIICKTIEAEDVKLKDVISFFDPAGNGTSIVTHRVIEIVEEDGTLSFRTQGDNNNTEDKELVPAENLVGIYKSRIPGAGHVAMFMQSTAGLIICVVLPIILLVAYDLIRRRIYEKNKQSDNDALLAELEALRAEKAAKEKAAAENDTEDKDSSND